MGAVPELTIVRDHRRCERIDDTVLRSQYGPYAFVLDATADGIVTRYSTDLWIARSISISGR